MQLIQARRVRSMLAAISLLAWSFSVLAADYCPDRPLRVALFEFGVFLDGASMKGIDPDFIALLEKRTGCRFEIVVMPRARHWIEMKEGSIDVVTVAISTPEREQLMHLVPYLRARNVLVLGSEVPVSIKDFKGFLDTPGLKLGVVRGFRHEPALDEFIASLRAAGRLREEVDAGLLFQALASGTVAAIPSEPVVYPTNLKRFGLTGKVRIGDWLPRDQFVLGSVGLSRRSFTEAQVARWRTLIKTLQADGSLQRMATPYLPSDVARGLFRVSGVE